MQFVQSRKRRMVLLTGPWNIRKLSTNRMRLFWASGPEKSLISAKNMAGSALTISSTVRMSSSVSAKKQNQSYQQQPRRIPPTNINTSNQLLTAHYPMWKLIQSARCQRVSATLDNLQCNQIQRLTELLHIARIAAQESSPGLNTSKENFSLDLSSSLPPSQNICSKQRFFHLDVTCS